MKVENPEILEEMKKNRETLRDFAGGICRMSYYKGWVDALEWIEKR